jgi:anti-sigma B factor antagonist
MQFEAKTLDSGVLHVTLAGRLDMEAAVKLENPFTFRVASQKAPVVVDLAAVDFIASIGFRLLLKNAKAQQARGGKLVLCQPAPLVREALVMAGIGSLIPIHEDFEAACREALG